MKTAYSFLIKIGHDPLQPSGIKLHEKNNGMNKNRIATGIHRCFGDLGNLKKSADLLPITEKKLKLRKMVIVGYSTLGIKKS